MPKKIIKKWGNCVVITFNSEEQKIYNLEVGDVVNLQIKHLTQKELEDEKR